MALVPFSVSSEFLNLLLIVPRQNPVLCNRKLDRIDNVAICPLAKVEVVFMRRMGVARVVKVGFHGSDKDVTVRETQKVWAVATLGEVQGDGALSVGSGVGDQWRQRVGPGHRQLRNTVHRRRECSWNRSGESRLEI